MAGSHWIEQHWIGPSSLTISGPAAPSLTSGGWWITSLNSMLSQNGQLLNIERNAFGATSITTITTTRCFCFQETQERQRDQYRLTKTADFVAILPSSLDLLARPDDQVRDIINTQGRTVVVAGTITEIVRYEHWEHGLQFLVAGIQVAG